MLGADEAAGADRISRRPLIGFALPLAALVYTHNWGLFFAGA